MGPASAALSTCREPSRTRHQRRRGALRAKGVGRRARSVCRRRPPKEGLSVEGALAPRYDDRSVRGGESAALPAPEIRRAFSQQAPRRRNMRSAPDSACEITTRLSSGRRPQLPRGRRHAARPRDRVRDRRTGLFAATRTTCGRRRAHRRRSQPSARSKVPHGVHRRPARHKVAHRRTDAARHGARGRSRSPSAAGRRAASSPWTGATRRRRSDEAPRAGPAP